MRTLDQETMVSERNQRILRELKQVIQRHLSSAEVVLFGSVARGTEDSESDYDILVLTDASLDRREQNSIRGAVFDWEIDEGIVVSMLFRTKEEWNSPIARISPFRSNVEKDAVLL